LGSQPTRLTPSPEVAGRVGNSPGLPARLLFNGTGYASVVRLRVWSGRREIAPWALARPPWGAGHAPWYSATASS